MSSTNFANEKYTLTSLPLSILTRILGYLCPHHPFRTRINRLKAAYHLPFRDPPVTLSLDCGDTLTVPLPSELRSPALASPILASAAANLLGERVSFLTYCNTNGQLSEWIQAFAPCVKAVSITDEIHDLWRDDIGGHKAILFMPALLNQIDRAIHVFKTISVNAIRLEVLDLRDVPFLNLSIQRDDLVAGLCATLESSSVTLRELALPVIRNSHICNTALQMSTLKRLDVLSLNCTYRSVAAGSKRSEPSLLLMIRAINGHADRSRKLTTLRDLRVINAPSLEYDSVTPSDRKLSLFSSVKTLRLGNASVKALTDATELFILLFKNLQHFWWNFCPRFAHPFLKKLCARASEVHLSGSRWFSNSIEVGHSEHFKGSCLFVGETSSDGSGVDINDKKFWSESIRTLLAGVAFQTDLRNLIMNCPGLENLSVIATRENMRVLRKLVKKCQQMKCLELVIDEKRNEGFGEEEWRSLSRTIPESHNSLRQVAIQDMGDFVRPTKCLEGVFDCFEIVAKALGERAKRLAFRMLFRTRSGVRIIERTCRLINTCIECTPALESLEVTPGMCYGDTSDYNGEREQAITRHLQKAENRLIQEVQSLRKLDLGGVVKLWYRVNRDH